MFSNIQVLSPRQPSKSMPTKPTLPANKSSRKNDVKAESFIQNEASHIEKGVKCSGNNPAKQFCLTEKCKSHHIFTCFDFHCKCHSEHENCQKSLISSIVSKIKRKLSDPTSVLKQEVKGKFDQIIMTLTLSRDNLLFKIEEEKEKIKQNQISEVERLFLAIIEQNELPQKISAVESRKLWVLLNEESHGKHKNLDQLKQQLDRFQTKEKQNVQILNNRLNRLLQEFNAQDNSTISVFKSPGGTYISLDQQIIAESLIVKSLKEAKDLIKTFSKQKVIGLKMIFRASQNDFSMKKYFEICGSETNTLIICQTNKDKIIGAFTPLSHEFTGKHKKDFLGNETVSDSKKASFIFSLTNNDIFELIKEQMAIYRYKSKSFIEFGESEFRICDKSDKNADCLTFLNRYYWNPNYKKYQLSSYARLTGNQSEKFSTKEWEVWKVQFDKVL